MSGDELLDNLYEYIILEHDVYHFHAQYRPSLFSFHSEGRYKNLIPVLLLTIARVIATSSMQKLISQIFSPNGSVL